MDNFDNFFDGTGNNDGGNNGGYYYRTPVYHTPDPEPPSKDGRRFTRVTVLFVVIAVIMCLAMIVNIVVLTSLKDEIAANYAKSMTEAVYSQYYDAVKAVADDMEISDDILNALADRLNTSAAKVAGEQTVYSTVNIQTEFTTSFYDGTSKPYKSSSSGFLITAADANGNTKRYVVTNAHCVLYPTVVSTGYGFLQQTSYKFAQCSDIQCSFSVGDDAGTKYSLKIVKVGSYYEAKSNGEPVSYDYQELPDLAILEFSGATPDSSEHPSLNVALADTASYGDDIAIVGYPMYEDISVTDGVISSPAHKMDSWGAGDFFTISAAVNSGNSGGPLVNNRNEVLGVVEASMSLDYAENIGYAVTAAALRSFASDSDIGGVSLTIINA